ncbi:MAG: hypothetical protein ACKO37_03365 [Vampirovibrionales bacterium]
MKIPIVNKDDYIIWLEYFEDAYWAHVNVFRWSANVKRSYVRDLDRVQNLIEDDLFGIAEANNQKLIRFGQMSGFHYLKAFTGTDQKDYKVFKRSL